MGKAGPRQLPDDVARATTRKDKWPIGSHLLHALLGYFRSQWTLQSLEGQTSEPVNAGLWAQRPRQGRARREQLQPVFPRFEHRQVQFSGAFPAHLLTATEQGHLLLEDPAEPDEP